MRLTSLALLLPFTLLLPACNGGGGETGTTDPGTTGTPGTGSTTAPTTGASTTTGDPTTTEVSVTATGSSSTTGEPDTTTSGTTGPATTTSGSTGPVDSSTGDPDTTTTDASSSGETGISPQGGCVTDKDCALHNDCCDCFGEAADDPGAICKKGCDTLTCDLLGIDTAVCRFGVCVTEKIDCDASEVLCDALPPDCPKGQVAGVSNGCWSGHCVPALSCDVVPECAACPAGTMCVDKQAQLPARPTCEPIPAECAGEIDCECAGQLVCVDAFN
ncbi:MAG: hypothetical protein IAG13_04260, partial [Deltaproteobacteria bacterium]|nr:hypothetical protein [Nannocystaceae bacterium]